MPVQITPSSQSRLSDIALRVEGLNNQDRQLDQNDRRLDLSSQQFDQASTQAKRNSTLKAIELTQKITEHQNKTKEEKDKVEREAFFKIIETAKSPEEAIALAKQIGPSIGQSDEDAEAFGQLPPEVFTDPAAAAKLRELDQGDKRLAQGERKINIDERKADALIKNNELLSADKARKAKADADKAEQEVVDNERKTEIVAQTKNRMGEIVKDLLGDLPAFEDVFGTFDGVIPSGDQDTINAENKIKQLVNMLTLQNVDAVPGVLSDSDILLLKEAGTILSNFRTGDQAAIVELRRIGKTLGLSAEELGIPSERAGSGGIEGRGAIKTQSGATVVFDE